AHEAGLVHRDVKPSNILVSSATRGGVPSRVFLSDFGLSKRVDSKSRMTKTGSLLGTLEYMAPELLRGAEVGRSADEYALGCVLFECLAGSVPFRRDIDAQVVAAHLLEPPPSLVAARSD